MASCTVRYAGVTGQGRQQQQLNETRVTRSESSAIPPARLVTLVGFFFRPRPREWENRSALTRVKDVGELTVVPACPTKSLAWQKRTGQRRHFNFFPPADKFSLLSLLLPYDITHPHTPKQQTSPSTTRFTCSQHTESIRSGSFSSLQTSPPDSTASLRDLWIFLDPQQTPPSIL